MEEEMLPKFDYYLDESDPDVVFCVARTAHSLRPSAPEGPPLRASWRQPKRITVNSSCVFAHARSRSSP
jgi:hypothetical protein